MTSGLHEMRLASAETTRAAGRAFGKAVLSLPTDQPLLISLRGELGAGKTTLVSGVMAALGHVGAVRSPTYTLIEPYALAGRDVYHLDLYRLTDPAQLEELGLRDLLLPSAVLLIEWPERAGNRLSKADLTIQLGYPEQGADGRLLTMQAHTEIGKRLADSAHCSVVDE